MLRIAEYNTKTGKKIEENYLISIRQSMYMLTVLGKLVI